VDAPQFVLLVGAGPEVALGVKAQAVGPAARLQESGQLAVGAPLEDAVVGLVGEVDVAVGVGGGAFGELEVAGEFFQFRTGCDDGAFAAGESKQHRSNRRREHYQSS